MRIAASNINLARSTSFSSSESLSTSSSFELSSDSYSLSSSSTSDSRSVESIRSVSSVPVVQRADREAVTLLTRVKKGASSATKAGAGATLVYGLVWTALNLNPFAPIALLIVGGALAAVGYRCKKSIDEGFCPRVG